MLVVLDSNILIADFPWRSAPFGLLLGELRRHRLQVAIPRLVVQETSNKYAERVMKAINEAKSSRATLNRLGHASDWSVPMLNTPKYGPPSRKTSYSASQRAVRNCWITHPQSMKGLSVAFSTGVDPSSQTGRDIGMRCCGKPSWNS